MTAPGRKENLQALIDWVEYSLGEPDITGAHPNIEYVHHEIHSGAFYTLSERATVAAGTANALAVAIRPATGRTAHFQGIVSAKKSGYAELYENATVVASGTVTPFNNDRTSANAWGGTIVTVDSVIAQGTLLQSRSIGANNPPSRLGGEANTRNEWILSPDYWYLVWFVADDADTQVTLDSEFYDEENFNA